LQLSDLQFCGVHFDFYTIKLLYINVNFWDMEQKPARYTDSRHWGLYQCSNHLPHH